MTSDEAALAVSSILDGRNRIGCGGKKPTPQCSEPTGRTFHCTGLNTCKCVVFPCRTHLHLYVNSDWVEVKL